MSAAGVDVFVPCYNYGRYLRDSVGSVLQETRIPVRVLIIDDASTDGSAEAARRLAREDDRVQVVEHAVNRGHIATYNEGIDWVEAPYMLLLSADDMVAPGALFRAVELMEQRPEVAFVYGDVVWFSNEEAPRQGTPGTGGDARGSVVSSGLEFIRQACDARQNPVETATAVVRTRVQKYVGGYDPDLPHSGDLEMWLRCATQGQVGRIGAVQAYVRLHAKNMRHDYGGAQFHRDYMQKHAAYARFFQGLGAAVPGGAELMSRTETWLAADLFAAAQDAADKDRPFQDFLTAALQMNPQLRASPACRRILLRRWIRARLGERAWSWLSAAKAALAA